MLDLKIFLAEAMAVKKNNERGGTSSDHHNLINAAQREESRNDKRKAFSQTGCDIKPDDNTHAKTKRRSGGRRARELIPEWSRLV